MLPRRVNLIILAFWVFAAWELFVRDILPDLVVGPPPDFRSIAKTETKRESRWSILIEDGEGRNRERSVGQIVTRSIPQSDGGLRLTSEAWFDSGAMLKGTPIESIQGDRYEVLGSCWIDSRGNLVNFRVSLHESRARSSDLVMIEGVLKGDEIHITTGGIIPYLGPRTFAYEPHSMVQTSFSPLDWLPGLRVGQTWEQQVVNPITRQTMRCRSEVVGRQNLMYDGNMTETLVVVTKTGAMSSAKTWVRSDGLVIRQEVPLMICDLMLQRIPDDPLSAPGFAKGDSDGLGGDSAGFPPRKSPAPDDSERRNPGDRR